jgi:RHS repeat-associated protein
VAGYLANGSLADMGTTIKFTGKERDTETWLDYFGARYFSGAQATWTSVDPQTMAGDVGNPQDWNRYAYSLNNPLRYLDPDGAQWMDAGPKKIGTASFNSFREYASVDVASFGTLVLRSEGIEHTSKKDLDPKASPGLLFGAAESHDEGDEIGRCTAGCFMSFGADPVGANIMVSFTPSGANITFPIDPTAVFIGPEDPLPVAGGWSSTGATPSPQAFAVSIDPNSLKNLSLPQLQALDRAAADNVRYPNVREALRKAIRQEQRRREEEHKKNCQSQQGTGCSSPVPAKK